MSDLVALSNHDMDAAYIRDVNTRAGRQLSVRELVGYRNSTRSSGTPSPAAPPAPAADEKERDKPPFDDTVVDGRWTLVSRGQGWLQLDIDWANVNQWRRFVRESDMPGFSSASATSFRIEQDGGVFSFEGPFERGRGSGTFTFAPNRGFADTLRSLGVREADFVGIHMLKNLAFGFIGAAAIREFMAAGLTPMTLREVLDLAVRQVTPAYVRDLKALGVRGIVSVKDIVEVRFADVPVAYVRELHALGFTALEHRDLIDLFRAGVTADFIRQQQASGRRDIPPRELIDLKRRYR